MLIALAADVSRAMLHRALTAVSMLCCVLVVGSFLMFAADQAAGASQHQQKELTTGQFSDSSNSGSTRQRGQPGRFIDNAAHTLTAPFTSIVQSQNPWVTHGVPAVLGIIVYGVGLGYVARFSRGFA